jgi:hypothetical protein
MFDDAGGLASFAPKARFQTPAVVLGRSGGLGSFARLLGRIARGRGACRSRGIGFVRAGFRIGRGAPSPVTATELPTSPGRSQEKGERPILSLLRGRPDRFRSGRSRSRFPKDPTSRAGGARLSASSRRGRDSTRSPPTASPSLMRLVVGSEREPWRSTGASAAIPWRNRLGRAMMVPGPGCVAGATHRNERTRKER